VVTFRFGLTGIEYLLFSGLLVYAPVIQFNSGPQKSSDRRNFFHAVHNLKQQQTRHRMRSAASGDVETRGQNPHRVSPSPLFASVSKAFTSAATRLKVSQFESRGDPGQPVENLNSFSMGFEIFDRYYLCCVDNFCICFIKAGNSSPPDRMACSNKLIYWYIFFIALRFP
jgi:hypothetical protein